MYGPVPTPPQRRRVARAGIVLLRIVLTAVPVLSLGMLGWIPMLRLAIVHRSRRDWLLFSAVAAASIGGMTLIGSSNSENDWRTTTAMILLLGTAFFVPAYFLAVELRPRQAHRTPWPEGSPAAPLGRPGYPSPGMPRQDRIEQVRAGLDELSAYLQQQDHS